MWGCVVMMWGIRVEEFQADTTVSANVLRQAH